MTESVVEAVSASPAGTTPKKKAATKSKSAAKKLATHPPTAQMVNAAIKALNERGGSSLQAIKKYISGTYKIDAEKLAPFIKKYLKSATDGGKLIRTKGKGASGSFKLASKAEPKKKAVAPKKNQSASKSKKEKAAAKPKKAKSPKKPAAAKKAVKPKAAAKPKSPKVKKVKSPKKAAKTVKSPKPKKAAPKKVVKKVAKK